MKNVTPKEKKDSVKMVRMLVGDTDGCMFYPMMGDTDILDMLVFEKWNILRAAKRTAMTIAFMLSSHPTRERTYDVEVWNEYAKTYQKVLEKFLDDTHSLNIPNDIIPYAAGIARDDFLSYRDHPNTNRSGLAQITHCNAWWTKIDKLR